MTEQDALARLAAANPVPAEEVRDAAASSARAQFLLRTVLSRPRRRFAVTSRRRLRWALLPAGLVAAAVAAVAVLQTPAPPAPDPPVVTSAMVLNAAAEQAGQDAGRARFVHVTGTAGRVVHLDSAGGYDVIRVDAVRSVQPAGGLPGEGWLTIGEAGTSVRPLTAADAAAYARDGAPDAAALPRDPAGGLHPDLAGDHGFEGDVAALPDDPAQTGSAMIAWLAEQGLPVPPDPQGWLFRTGTGLLDTFTSVAGSKERAKIYRMLAGLTGVSSLGPAADPLGRPSRGLAYTERTTRFGLIEWQVYLGADSDLIMYSQAVVRQPGPANASLSPGAVQYSTAVTSVAWSDKP
ncbi:hypothetical protein [Actinoplanes friuliensis]|uniref:CU044_5270 family protein n=1 Tax=Actinoplanes friuliensis DSM 7358 TaxID=1246995 RepID=U5VY51_9ACTN|nr:hypothetical protein [Actinoplanes friuliensis]AGZ41819.1 hypothetical protein AFR_17705 [Actinoplanes friuliensis DSM 7358]